jgi:hypothetical protein
VREFVKMKKMFILLKTVDCQVFVSKNERPELEKEELCDKKTQRMTEMSF